MSIAPTLRLLLFRLRTCSCSKRRRLRAFSTSMCLGESVGLASWSCDVDATAEEGGDAGGATTSTSNNKRDVKVADEFVDCGACDGLLTPVDGCRVNAEEREGWPEGDGECDCDCNGACTRDCAEVSRAAWLSALPSAWLGPSAGVNAALREEEATLRICDWLASVRLLDKDRLSEEEAFEDAASAKLDCEYC